MTEMITRDDGRQPVLSNGRLLQTLPPALSDTDRFGLPVDAPAAQWIAHVVQIGTCQNKLNEARHINLSLEQSQCGAVWMPVPVSVGPTITSNHFACIDDQSLDGHAYGKVYVPGTRFSRVRIDFVGVCEEPVPMSALALVGPLKGTS